MIRNLKAQMVLAGQDAWRKHPLLSGCWRNPFPGLRIAVGIFATYIAVESIIGYVAGRAFKIYYKWK